MIWQIAYIDQETFGENTPMRVAQMDNFTGIHEMKLEHESE